MTTMPAAAGSSSGFGWTYLSLQGRATRFTWWIWGVVALVIANVVLSFIAGFLDVMLGLSFGMMGVGPLSIIASLLLIYPWVCVCGKRWHDRNKSAWFVLIVYGPLIATYVCMFAVPAVVTIVSVITLIGALWTIVECGFLRGTVGDNRYGSDPLGGK